MQIMDTRKKRLLWLDYAKLTGIYMVMFGHLPLIMADERWHCFYSSIAVPIFFIVSGFLEKDEPVGTTVKKGVKSLLIPYAYLYLITYPYWLLIISPSLPDCDNTLWDKFIEPMLGLLLGESSPGSFYRSTNVPLWFLPALFLCKSLFGIITKLFRKTGLAHIVFSLLAIVFTGWFSQTNYNLLFSLDSAVMSLPFYVFGYYLKKHVDKMNFKKWGWLFLSLASFVIVFILSKENGRPSINSLLYGKNILIYYFTAITGSMGLIFFSRIFSDIRIPYLLYLGKNTLVVLAFHIMIAHIVSILIYCVLFKYSVADAVAVVMNGLDIWTATVIVIITTLLSGGFIYVINRYFPFIVGKKRVES
jgi:fucose 4-O-acetylase-like acetyltransferase